MAKYQNITKLFWKKPCIVFVAVYSCLNEAKTQISCELQFMC